MLFWGIGLFLHLKFGFTKDLLTPFLLIIIGLISIKFYFDHKVQQIKTGLNKKENIELICRTLQELDWKYKKYSNTVDLEYEKYILKFINVTLLPLDDRILYCFQYHSTTSIGRFPIFIGIRFFLKKKFENEIHLKMDKMKAQST